MQRALGIDMTTPRSKSQQQIHSPSHQAKPIVQPQQPTSQPTAPVAAAQSKPMAQTQSAPSQPELGRGSPMHQSMARHHDQTRSAGSSPAHRPQSQAPPPAQDGLTKLFGFGASLLNQASTLINVDPLPTASTQPSPARGKVVFSNAASDNSAPGPQSQGQMGGPIPPSMTAKQPQLQGQQHQQTPSHEQKAVNCPLCKTQLNIGSSDPPNYNSCTQCHSQVCNLCGFNPTPHLVEKKEWLCLNCQTQRLMSGGGLDEPPLPIPHPSPKHQPMGSPRHQTPTSQQSPLHKPTTQQTTKPSQPQTQKTTQSATGVSGPPVTTTAKQPTETKTTAPSTTPVPATEAQKQTKATEEKIKTDTENQTTKETKPSQKKGEQITPIKEIKKSRQYDVSIDQAKRKTL
uniref:Bassoon presynaptic cytomatrix protein n=1 Tax=Oryzias melastigma TaxID=30732 RepID=A0A3B3D8N4_ORYME